MDLQFQHLYLTVIPFLREFFCMYYDSQKDSTEFVKSWSNTESINSSQYLSSNVHKYY